MLRNKSIKTMKKKGLDLEKGAPAAAERWMRSPNI